MKPHSHGCHHEHKSGLPELTDKLRQGSVRVTGPRRAILEVMRAHSKPLLIKEIHALVGVEQCDLVTIYRSMELLQGMGMVKRVDFGKGGGRFELSEVAGQGHHHHLVCTRCEQVLQLEDCLLQGVEKKIAKASGFSGVSHRLEFFGICPSCQ